ncbi:MAG: hypothetical protein H7288_03730 [Kineosporiaceae bacterium]|nr:hypothetical protein [Aeromicrobium sp.]
MPFADPHVCPSCGGFIAGESRCPYCRFDLSSPASRRLWQTLLQADSLLDEARRVSSATVAAQPGVGATPPLSVPGPRSEAGSAVPARRWSTGSIILGLGALCLLVAAFVFITVSWGVLGPTGRTFVLLVITLAIAAAAVWSTRAGLRASSEALWAVFFGLFAIDFFAARAYELLGLDSFTDEQAVLVFGLVAAYLGAAIALGCRKTLAVMAPSIAAGLAVWTSSFAVAATLDGAFFWRGFAGLALAAASTGIARRLSLTLTAWIAGAAALVFYVIAVGGAIDELASSPHLGDLVGHGHGISMIVMIAVTAAAGLASPSLTRPAATLVTLGAGSLVFAPSEAASQHEGGFIAVAILVIVLSIVLIRGASDWIRGARVATAAILVSLAIASLGWFGNAFGAVGRSNGRDTGNSWTSHLTNTDALPGPGWLAIVAIGAIATTVFATLRWPELRTFAKPVAVLPPTVAGVGVALGVIAYEPPVLLAAFVVLGLGIGTLVLVRSERGPWLGVAMVMIAAPAGMTLVSQPVTLVVWLAVAATLAGIARLFAPVWSRRVGAFGAAALVIGAAALGADLASLGDLPIRILVVVTSLLALVLASFPLSEFIGRREIEVAAGLGMTFAVISGAEMTLGSQALVFTVAGVPIIVLGLFVRDRQWLRIVGSAALGIAWVMRLLASDIDTIEAYTTPFALVLLGAGSLVMRSRPQLPTAIALTPGLTLALLPSIPQALADPTGLRALLLGLGGLVALGLGVWRQWQMPFVYGSVVVAVLVVWNVGPLANGLPRWILIAAAGVILVGSGITWEHRVASAKSAVRYVQNLR